MDVGIRKVLLCQHRRWRKARHQRSVAWVLYAWSSGNIRPAAVGMGLHSREPQSSAITLTAVWKQCFAIMLLWLWYRKNPICDIGVTQVGFANLDQTSYKVEEGSNNLFYSKRGNFHSVLCVSIIGVADDDSIFPRLQILELNEVGGFSILFCLKIDTC